MKNIRTLSDSELLSQIRFNAKSERKSGLLVIHQLREIARRRLDAKLGFSSLHAYCMEELKYSPGSAWRRIKAMQALAALPELEEKIEQGALTLANVSQVQAFCDQNKKTVEEKKSLFEKVEGLSKRETERVLAEIAPQAALPEKVRVLTSETSELRVNLSAETLAHLGQIRGYLAHSHPNASYSELISYLAKLGVERLNPARVRRGEEILPPGDVEAQQANVAIQRGLGFSRGSREQKNFGDFKSQNRAAVSAATRRLVWRRDAGRCQYVSSYTGRKCDADARLQIDHVQARALGGGNHASNLRLLCQRHNLLAAVQALGEGKMRRYVRNGCERM